MQPEQPHPCPHCEIEQVPDPTAPHVHLTDYGYLIYTPGHTMADFMQELIAEGRRQATEGWEREWGARDADGYVFEVEDGEGEERAQSLATWPKDRPGTVVSRLVGPWEPAAEQPDRWRLAEWAALPDECFIDGCIGTDIDQRGPVNIRGGLIRKACTEHWEPIFRVLGEQASWERTDAMVSMPAEQPEPATGGVVDPAGFAEPEPGCTLTIPPRPSDSAAAKLRSLWAQPHGGSCTCRECIARDEQSAPARIHVRHDPAALMEEPDLYADEKPERGVGWRLARDEEIQDAAHMVAMEERHQRGADEKPEGSDR